MLSSTDENFRAQEHELGQFAGQKSLVKLSDGSGYYVTVSVFHALHCVQRLHHYVYRDHYHPNLSEKDDFALKQHTGISSLLTLEVCTLNTIIDHCLDWLRQYVQCNADTTLIPIRWAEQYEQHSSKPKPILLLTPIQYSSTGHKRLD